MAIENVQQLLTEQLGKNGDTVVFTTAAQTSKDWYCVYFPVESVVASITVADATGESALVTFLLGQIVLVIVMIWYKLQLQNNLLTREGF